MKRVENFSEGQHTSSIKNEGKIYSACRDGKIPFNSATDISNVAFHALTDEKTCNTDYLILGPELLTYDEVYIFSRANPDMPNTLALTFPHRSRRNSAMV